MHVEVTREVVDVMKAVAELAHPHEACGILLGECGRIKAFKPACNVHHLPEAHFEIDPRALIDAHRDERNGGLQVLGYFHSHPNGPARPSATDRQMAAGDGRIWAIMGEGAIELWQDERDGFHALSCEIAED